jgi:uncharacterized protein
VTQPTLHTQEGAPSKLRLGRFAHARYPCYRLYTSVYTTTAVEFRWDERKNRINEQKHGISFEAASLVFDDPHHLTRQDREVDGETRWQTIGMVNGVHLLLVAHTVSDDDEEIRIISARKATRSERSIYAQSN